jgi:diguanylate cyclase (GGDEF)-like protein
MGGEGMTRDRSAQDEEGLDGGGVVDELTGLANRRGFMEILRLEERRQARYGGSPILVLVDVGHVVAKSPAEQRDELLVRVAATLAEAIRDTDTLARVDEHRFAILAIQAGGGAASIVGRLRLALELRRLQPAEVTVGEPGSLTSARRSLERPAPPVLRLVR